MNLRTGLSEHRLYGKWSQMHRRCYNPAHPQYKDYGGRGIKVCYRWRYTVQGVKNYIKDIEALGPQPRGCSLDRIDNDGDYEPRNIRWATHSQQMHNRRQGAGRASKLTEKDIAEIRAAKYHHRYIKELIAKFGLSRRYIHHIRSKSFESLQATGRLTAVRR